MAYDIYGDLDLHLGSLKRIKAEEVTTLPTANSANFRRIVVHNGLLAVCSKIDDGASVTYKWIYLNEAGIVSNIARKSAGIITVTFANGNSTDITVIGSDDVTNSMLANAPTNTIKGNNTNVSADPMDLTPAQVRTMLNVSDGAEVNQNAFSNVKNGMTTISAGAKTDTLNIEAGTDITITPDATNKKLTITHSTPRGTSVPTLNTATTPTTETVDVVSQVKGDSLGHVVSQDRVSVPTKKYVDDKIADIGSALNIKGTIGSSGATVTALPNNHKVGDTYIVKTEGTYAGQSCEVGDIIICTTTGTTASNNDWTVAQGNWTVVDGNSQLAWGTEVTLKTIGGKDIKAKMPDLPTLDTILDGSTRKLSDYTPKTRKVSAGTGLSGGGDLTADRTISHQAKPTSGTDAGGTGEMVSGVTIDSLGHVASTTKVSAGTKAQIDEGTDETARPFSAKVLNEAINTDKVKVYDSGNLTGQSGTVTVSTMTTIAMVQPYINGSLCMCDISVSGNKITWSSNTAFTSSSNFKLIVIGI